MQREGEAVHYGSKLYEIHIISTHCAVELRREEEAGGMQEGEAKGERMGGDAKR